MSLYSKCKKIADVLDCNDLLVNADNCCINHFVQ
uniref:Uncharacterized protein n=1 Tax=Arundo donax TaxID=35708 RepID=A0A0A9FMS1_ARUDO